MGNAYQASHHPYQKLESWFKRTRIHGFIVKQSGSVSCKSNPLRVATRCGKMCGGPDDSYFHIVVPRFPNKVHSTNHLSLPTNSLRCTFTYKVWYVPVYLSRVPGPGQIPRFLHTVVYILDQPISCLRVYYHGTFGALNWASRALIDVD